MTKNIFGIFTLVLPALVILSFFCVWASPDIARFFSAETFHFFSDIVSGILCFSLYVLIGFGLLFMPR
jgi:hypothetical protein